MSAMTNEGGMMEASSWRHADFQRLDYGSFVRRSQSIGRIDLLDAYQTPGNFSDRASGDIVIMRALGRAHCHLNLGAGEFSQWTAPGDFAVNPAGYDNSIIVDQHHRVDGISVPWNALKEVDVDNLLPQDSDLGKLHSNFTQDAGISEIMHSLWSAESVGVDSLEESTALLAIMSRLLALSRDHRACVPSPIERLTSYQLSLCIERLRHTQASTPTLKELAALCGLSPFHFCRAFKAATGLPPHRYLIADRMERARILLLTQRQSISEIAAAVGYDDPAYFSRLFVQETGASPSAWRREASK